MATTYTTLLKLAKPTQGELDGSWGTVVNDNITTMIEEAIAGRSVINTWSTNSHTLTTADGTTAESRAAMLSLTDTGDQLGTNAATVICPALSKIYIVKNAVRQAATLKTASGTGVAIPNGTTSILFCDGTNVEEAINNFTGSLTTAAIAASGAITSTGDITAAGTLLVTGDTAAGDDAAIGYTSAEGLILTGQGSTNDVTIKNDADADVITIATGGTSVDIVGDVTAATVNADGDTSAGDNAAMGYTAAEGLILTGQGSTNDVTIKNDADADVIEIPTGTQNVTFAGGVTVAGDITLTGDVTTASNANVDINPNGTGDVVLKTDLVSVGGGSEVGHVSSNGAYDMKISTNSGTNSGTIVITDAANGAITFAPNGTGIVDVQGSMNSSISTTGKSIVFGF